MGEVHRLPVPQVAFGLQTAGCLMTEIFPQWVQDLALLVESVETVRPPGALPDWQPGATVRLPYSRKVCGDDAAVCAQRSWHWQTPRWCWPVRPPGTATDR
jgi:hypothetical protein